LEIRTYEYFTLNELTVLWNRAFSGYYVNYEVDVDAFARQLVNWVLDLSRRGSFSQPRGVGRFSGA
jgi:hypothetical protein